VRPLLPLVQAPTLVLHRRGFQLPPIEHGRYLAQHLPGARLVELPGDDGTLMWETPELILDHIERFVAGAGRTAKPSRVLATVLFTDIVGSTAQASRVGDRRWGELLEVHYELASRLWRNSAANSSPPPAMGSWPCLTDLPEASAAQLAYETNFMPWASHPGLACTSVRSNGKAAMSVASPCTSQLGWWQPPAKARSSPPEPCATWSWAPISS
jgi:hypothetical protein